MLADSYWNGQILIPSPLARKMVMSREKPTKNLTTVKWQNKNLSLLKVMNWIAFKKFRVGNLPRPSKHANQSNINNT